MMPISDIFCCFNRIPNDAAQSQPAASGTQTVNQAISSAQSSITKVRKISNSNQNLATDRNSQRQDVVRLDINGLNGHGSVAIMMKGCTNITKGDHISNHHHAIGMKKITLAPETTPVDNRAEKKPFIAVSSHPNVTINKNFNFDMLVLNHGMTEANLAVSPYKNDGVYNATDIHIKDINNESIPGLRCKASNASAVKDGRIIQHITIEDGAVLRGYRYTADVCIITLIGTGALLCEPDKNTEIIREHAPAKRAT